jgi:ribosomal-protein-alanine N-acetyltransferase
MSVTGVRRAKATDVRSIIAIERESFSDPWGMKEFESALASPQTIFFVADDAAENLAGYVIALAVADECEILNLAVAQSKRRTGLGATLLDSALESAASRGAEQFYLEVRESNEPARRLYASRGFNEISRRKRYYRDPVEDALVLHLAAQR